MESIESKQNYLRENILNKGYDPNIFMEFLHSKRGEEGVDLNNWMLLDLQNCVQEFCAQFNNESYPSIMISTEPPQIENSTAPSNQKSNAGQLENINNWNDNNNNNNNNNNDFVSNPTTSNLPSLESEISAKTDRNNPQPQDNDGIIQVKKIEETQLTSWDSMKITLSYPEKVEGGLFSKSYVTYLVTTSPFDYRVRKRFSDFEWLRSHLISYYPGAVIPPMPNKNYADRFNEAFIGKRMRSLERFLQGIADDPFLRSTEVFLDFLKITKEADFNVRKQEYTKWKPTFWDDYKTSTGLANVNISPEKETYLSNIKDNTSINEAILKRLTVSFKAWTDEISWISQRMIEISNIFKELYTNSDRYYDNENVTNTYNIMYKWMNDWAESEKKQAILVNINIREYFKYVKNEFRSMKELITQCDLHKTNYTRNEEKLLARKEDWFKRQDLMKWEWEPDEQNNKLKLIQDKEYAFSKMLSKDTHNVAEFKKQYGFYLNRIIQEYERLRTWNGKRHKKHTWSFTQMHNDIFADLHLALADLVSFYNDENEENNSPMTNN